MSTPTPGPCPICRSNAQISSDSDFTHVVCVSCGDYFISEFALELIQETKDGQACAKVACRLRERQLAQGDDVPRFVIVKERPAPNWTNRPVLIWADLLASFPGTMQERAERGLVNMTRMTPNSLGQAVRDDHLLHKAMFCLSKQEAGFMQVHMIELGWIKLAANEGGLTGFAVTPKGWNHVTELQKKQSGRASRTVFFAFNMSDSSLSPMLESAFKKTAANTGYEPVIVNLIEHNGRIDDRILAELNRARFVVCDMTGQRQNVYFEAGYALGMDLQVVWCCHKDEIKNLHFDIRMFNHVTWETEDDLVERLTNRINATVR